MIIVLWNVRGSDGSKKRREIKDIIFSSSCDIILIQESKVSNPSPVFLSSMDGGKLDCWAHIDALGTFGGIFINSNSQLFDQRSSIKKEFPRSVSLHHYSLNKVISLTAVYGPNDKAH